MDITLEKKDEVYYRLNIQPNPNENGTNFRKKLVTKLLLEGKALSVFQKKYGEKVDFQYLAKSYETNSKILEAKEFKNVVLEDDEKNSFEFIRSFKLKDGECIYFTLFNNDILSATQKYKEKISELIDVAEKSYKSSNINKWRLKKPGGQPKIIDAETGKEIDYTEYKKKITDGLLSDEESIVLLSEAFELTLLNEKKTKDTSDLLKLFDECGNKVAMIFNIALDFITFSCNPIMKCIEDAYNGALILEKDFLKGEHFQFNRFMMQHIDITTLGTSLDKLTSIGFSFNQICVLLGLHEIDEDWANEHHITKNYADVKGGVEEDE